MAWCLGRMDMLLSMPRLCNVWGAGAMICSGASHPSSF